MTDRHQSEMERAISTVDVGHEGRIAVTGQSGRNGVVDYCWTREVQRRHNKVDERSTKHAVI